MNIAKYKKDCVIVQEYIAENKKWIEFCEKQVEILRLKKINNANLEDDAAIEDSNNDHGIENLIQKICKCLIEEKKLNIEILAKVKTLDNELMINIELNKLQKYIEDLLVINIKESYLFAEGSVDKSSVIAGFQVVPDPQVVVLDPSMDNDEVEEDEEVEEIEEVIYMHMHNGFFPSNQVEDHVKN